MRTSCVVRGMGGWDNERQSEEEVESYYIHWVDRQEGGRWTTISLELLPNESSCRSPAEREGGGGHPCVRSAKVLHFLPPPPCPSFWNELRNLPYYVCFWANPPPPSSFSADVIYGCSQACNAAWTLLTFPPASSSMHYLIPKCPPFRCSFCCNCGELFPPLAKLYTYDVLTICRCRMCLPT